jgi:hypothetical protein
VPGRPLAIEEFLTSPEYSIAIVGNPELGLRSQAPEKAGRFRYVEEGVEADDRRLRPRLSSR